MYADMYKGWKDIHGRKPTILSLGAGIMGEFSFSVFFSVFLNFLHKHELLL